MFFFVRHVLNIELPQQQTGYVVTFDIFMCHFLTKIVIMVICLGARLPGVSVFLFIGRCGFSDDFLEVCHPFWWPSFVFGAQDWNC